MRFVAGFVLAPFLLSGCMVATEDSPNPSSSGPPVSTGPAPSPKTDPAPTDTSGPGERVLPVVSVTSTLVRTYDNGTEWSPPWPGHHGCPDGFEVNETMRQILIHVYSYGGGTPAYTTESTDAAHAGVSVQLRDPGAYYRNSDLLLPDSLPNATELIMGNVQPFVVTLSVDQGRVLVNETEIPGGQTRNFTYEYAWRRSDGETLTVQEILGVHYVGDWTDPIRTVPRQGCL